MALRNWIGSTKNSQKPANRCKTRLGIELLEDRTVPSAVFDSVLGVGNDTTSILPWDNAVDTAGNTYVTGLLYGTMDLDPSVERPDGSDILTPRGSSDAFVAKYAPDNSLVWARRMGSDFVRSSNQNDPFEEGRRLALDTTGNVYVTGEFVSQADFGPFTLTSAGSTDAFVTKLDPNGNFVWAKSWGGATREHGSGIAVDAAGNVLAVGGTAQVFANGSWTSTGFEMRKYGSTGATVWSKRIDNWGGEATSVAADSAGNVFVVGSFKGTADFNPDPHKSYSVSGGSGSNGYVLKLTSAGNFAWVAPFIAKTAESSTAYSYCTDIALDGVGNVVVVGVYSGPVDFNPSAKVDYRLPNTYTYDGFVAKVSAAGALTWATSLGGTSPKSVAVDGAGSVYVIGSFYQIFSTSNGQDDVFVTKFTSAGVLDWAVTFGGTGSDLGTGIAVDAAGTIYLTGTYRKTVDFDPDPLGTHELTNDLYSDMFLLKLNQS